MLHLLPWLTDTPFFGAVHWVKIVQLLVNGDTSSNWLTIYERSSNPSCSFETSAFTEPVLTTTSEFSHVCCGSDCTPATRAVRRKTFFLQQFFLDFRFIFVSFSWELQIATFAFYFGKKRESALCGGLIVDSYVLIIIVSMNSGIGEMDPLPFTDFARHEREALQQQHQLTQPQQHHLDEAYGTPQSGSFCGSPFSNYSDYSGEFW